MVETVQLSCEHKHRLIKLVCNDAASEIDDITFSKSLDKVLLYPLDDVFLSKKHFNALISLLNPNESLYAMDCYFSCSTFSPDKVYRLTPPFEYDDYISLNLNPVCILYSDSFQWILAADEGLEGGEAVLAGNASFVERFKSIYGYSYEDLLSFLNFSIADFEKRKTSFAHCFNLIKMLK